MNYTKIPIKKQVHPSYSKKGGTFLFHRHQETESRLERGCLDAGSVSAYARQAMAWAVEQGIVAGTSDTTLTPQGNATRAQVAAILMRYIGVTAR